MILLRGLRVEKLKLLPAVDLYFPPRGAVLVEGLNESGKSTLFESVFFALYGLPLVTEGRGRGNLESLIRYGEESCSVRLWLDVEDVELEIQRTLRRGKPTQASLRIRRPGGPDERVAGVQAVNARVVEELGGLDSDTLLNSCFVEQKKLGKLEELGPAQRRDSVRRLLNLDRLTDLAERFRMTPLDEQALAQARNRLELAELAAQLPGVLAEKEDLEGQLGRVVLRGIAASEPAPESGWSEKATRLAEARAQAKASRRAALLLSAGGLVGLILIVGMLVLGLNWPSLGSPLLIVIAALAWRSYSRARALDAETTRLEADLASQRDLLVGRIGELDSRRKRLEEVLGVDSRGLEPEGCRQEVDRLTHQMEVQRQAAALVEGTMERIVRMVLPNTERNMDQILPLITVGRYHEARIASDYQIEVWDDSAGRYVSKSVFSGGARDQFSLALRLAFALATLPQELGTSPGFIFLDEPLSSLDGPRTEALVRLLTEGQVAESFSQIFVISHNRAFDPRAFPYRLVMREGRVVESNLPATPYSCSATSA